MFYTIPSAPSSFAIHSFRRRTTRGGDPLLPSRTDSHISLSSSNWSKSTNQVDEMPLPRKLLRGLKRITTRTSLKHQSVSLPEGLDSSAVAPSVDQEEKAVSFSRRSSLSSFTSETTYCESATQTAHRVDSSPVDEENKTSSKAKKRRVLKRLGHAIILCMGSMYTIPAGAPWVDGQYHASYYTPAPIVW